MGVVDVPASDLTTTQQGIYNGRSARKAKASLKRPYDAADEYIDLETLDLKPAKKAKNQAADGGEASTESSKKGKKKANPDEEKRLRR